MPRKFLGAVIFLLRLCSHLNLGKSWARTLLNKAMTKIGFNTRTEAKAEAERLAEINKCGVTLSYSNLDGVEWADEMASGEDLAYFVGDGYMIAWAHDDTMEERLDKAFWDSITEQYNS